MSLVVQNRLKGTVTTAILFELFTNTIHFPIANIILELLKTGVTDYITELDMYIILLSCFVQAYLLGKWNYEGKNLKFIGNLIAPALYTAIELPLEGAVFFNSHNHSLYWVIAFIIGVLQQLEIYSPSKLKTLLKITENIVRTYIVLIMYAIYELSLTDSPPFSDFLKDDSHLYFVVVIALLGLVIGFANVTADKYLTILQETAATMKTFSEWFLGGKLLSDALENNETLQLKRMERTVIFIDIRGFTSWSEKHTPEEIVKMLNRYFEISEEGWTESNIIKIKYTGDEIMAICEDKDIAIKDVININRKITHLLAQHGLSAGTGVHAGQLVEGIIGGGKVKAYDVIGDTVNTAKRICDKASENKIFASKYFIKGLKTNLKIVSESEIDAKGKADKIAICHIS